MPALMQMCELDVDAMARAAAVAAALAPEFALLGYTDDPARLELAGLLAASGLPVDRRLWRRYARRRLDVWLRRLALRALASDSLDLYTLRAALLALEVGRAWPDALLDAEPDPAFVAAWAAALPLAMPPEKPLAMPEQALAKATMPALQVPRAPRLWWRRLCVFGPTVALVTTGAAELLDVFAPGGIGATEWLLVMLFVINFAWIGLACITALVGFYALARRLPPLGLAPAAPDAAPRSRVAVLMPTCNEAPRRVFGTMAELHRALAAAGVLEHFDFFVLSDTTQPEVWLAEEAEWDATRRALGAGSRLHYRRRYTNVARKAGNIADFCRRWGGAYDHMLMLDADSHMSAAAVVEMVCLLDANPHAGLVQTVPRLHGRSTLFARAQQFANAVYGPVFAAGLAYWSGRDANYWGHNALIRVAAFAAHAGLPVLGGRTPFSGHVLSHDFVEAALMRRAGWTVHMLPLLGGSYEESPPSLLEHADRDRRWCQGNLQHLAVLRAAGLHPVSRFHLLTGIMSYLVSPLWLAFILVGMGAALQAQFQLPVYFFPNRTPYPVWQVIDPELAVQLFVATMTILLVPKLCGLLAIVMAPARARRFGGRLGVSASVLVETLYSALLAPVQMLLQSRCVYDVMRGRDSGWNTQKRDERGLPFALCWGRHRYHTAGGLVLGVAAWVVHPALLGWMLPALFGLVVAAPVSWLGARPAVGAALRRAGLLCIPEEIRETAPIAADGPPVLPAPTLGTLASDARLASLHLALLTQVPPPGLTEQMALMRCLVAAGKLESEQALDPRLAVALLSDRPAFLTWWRRAIHLG